MYHQIASIFVLLTTSLVAAQASTSESAQAPQQVVLFSKANYTGDMSYPAVDGTCVNLSSLSPDLTGKVQSAYGTVNVSCTFFDQTNCAGYTLVINEGGVPDIPTTDHTVKSVNCTSS